MAGNVWQWTSDWYQPDYYVLAATESLARNPKGLDSPYDPSHSGELEKVDRGGSFLCTDQYCSRYMVGAVPTAFELITSRVSHSFGSLRNKTSSQPVFFLMANS